MQYSPIVSNASYLSNASCFPKSRGATMWSTLAIVLMIGFIAFLAFKLMFVYIDHSIVKGSMQEIANQPGFNKMSRSEIKSAIGKRLTIDSIRDMPKDFYKLTKDRSGRWVIHVQYEKKVPIAGNVSALVLFTEDIEAKPE